MTKFRSERYITQIQNKDGTWKFKVRYKGFDKTFNEKDYLSSRLAFQDALAYRNDLLVGKIFSVKGCNKTVEDLLYESFELFPVREQTQKKMKCMFNKYIHLDKTITDLKKEDIIKSLNAMIEIASDDTINRVFYVYKRIIQTALIKEYIYKDITLGIKPPLSHFLGHPKAEKITDKQTIEEVANLCRTKFISQYDRKLYPLMLWFLYYTGCRPCEMFALLKSDIHDGYLTICKEIGSSLEENNVVRQCKTPLSNRNIPITKELQSIIDSAIKLNNSEILFPDKYNQYLNSTYVGSRLKHICDNHNIKFNMYQIRHLFSTDLERNNVDPRTHQELMGHKNYTMSINYARSNMELKENAIKNR